MSTDSIGENENSPVGKTDDYYERLASQEEIYLERIEENLRAIAIREMDESRATVKLDELRESAAESLIEGDSDDAPLSEETIDGMRQER
jgi:hypothetical protein